MKKLLLLVVSLLLFAILLLASNYNKAKKERQSVIDSYERYEDPHSSSEILIVPVSDTVEAHVSEGFDPSLYYIMVQ